MKIMTMSHFFQLHIHYNLLLYFLFKPTIINCNIIIEDCGIKDINDNDMAIIFYLTIRNIYEHDVNINVEMLKCHEIRYGYNDNHMLLIGGNMGIFQHNKTKNATLIYTNLYLRNRVGKCLISIQYNADNCRGEIQQEIEFDTRNNDEKLRDNYCRTYDLDEMNSCKPVDCVIKYSSKRSYFNHETKICEPVITCQLDSIYLPNTNECRNINEILTKTDIEQLEDGQYEEDDTTDELYNFECHHGKIDQQTGDCYCDPAWITSPYPETPYQPNLAIYHMCNVELVSWQKSNRKKLFLTILAIFIFTLAILAKMLLIIYFLKWCYNTIRNKYDKRKLSKKSPTQHDIDPVLNDTTATVQDDDKLLESYIYEGYE